MTWAYYNEFEPYPAQWLRNLIAAGHILAGEVDERDIREVSGDDLKGFGQCHFFAGLGGWAYACRLASIPDDFPLWTGSCPCQPLSSAGQRKGHADERHLWPAFHALIAERRPATVFGEQVASKDGREWLAGVRADLEHLGYAVGAADLPAASVGAPHIRQRLWWVADAMRRRPTQDGKERQESPHSRASSRSSNNSPDGRLADANDDGSLDDQQSANGRRATATSKRGGDGRLGNPTKRRGPRQSGTWRSFWSGERVACADGKARRIGTGIQPLAHGVPARVGKLRAVGNAIVPQLAAEFMMACLEDV